MKMKIFNNVLVLLILVATGCGWTEDPLADKDEKIRNARLAPPPVEKPQATDSQSLIIDAPTSVTFLEESENTIDIKVRVLDQAYKRTVLSVTNLSSFPGARFDGLTNKFTWKPARGTTGGDISYNIPLMLKANAYPADPGGVIFVRQEVVQVFVQKNAGDPIISSVNFGSVKNLREGSRALFTVVVKDLDSSTQNPPTLQFTAPATGLLSVAPYISLSGVDIDLPNSTWKFNYTLELRDVELTGSSNQVGFELVAYNQFGHRSSTNKWQTKVFTKLGAAMTTWKDAKTLYLNEDNTLSFVVYDPKGEANLVMSRINTPPGATFDCPVQSAGVMECELKMHPKGDPKDFPKSGFLDFLVTSKNQDTWDNETKDTRMTLKFNIVARQPTPAAVGGL